MRRKFLEYIHARHQGHRQIEKDKIDVMILEHIESDATMLREQEMVVVGEYQAIRFPYAEFIINREDRVHPMFLSRWVARRPL